MVASELHYTSDNVAEAKQNLLRAVFGTHWRHRFYTGLVNFAVNFDMNIQQYIYIYLNTTV